MSHQNDGRVITQQRHREFLGRGAGGEEGDEEKGKSGRGKDREFGVLRWTEWITTNVAEAWMRITSQKQEMLR